MPKKINNDEIVIKNSAKLDENESVFFSRQLEYIKTQAYEVEYPEITYAQDFPVSFEAGEWADTITYRQTDMVGTSKIIANYADDLPSVNVFGEEFTSKVRGHGNKYSYSVQDIRKSMQLGTPLNSRLAMASREAYEFFVQDVAWKARPGDANYHGLVGFLYSPNITTGTAANTIDSSSTPDQILAVLNLMYSTIMTVTKKREMPNRLYLPIEQLEYIRSTPRSSTSDTTILDFWTRTHPGVVVDSRIELSDVSPLPSDPTGSDTADCAVMYRYDPLRLTLEIPLPYTQHPVQPENLVFTVPTDARIGGVIMTRPLSAFIMEGI